MGRMDADSENKNEQLLDQWMERARRDKAGAEYDKACATKAENNADAVVAFLEHELIKAREKRADAAANLAAAETALRFCEATISQLLRITKTEEVPF